MLERVVSAVIPPVEKSQIPPAEIIVFPTRKERNTEKWNNTTSFVNEIFQEESFLHIKPSIKGITQERWEEDISTVHMYVRIPNISFQEIGRIKKRGRASVKMKFRDAIVCLWNFKASEETKSRYPLESLGFVRPNKPVKKEARNAISLAHGGISVKVKEYYLSGHQSPEQIKKHFNLTGRGLSRIRRTLKPWGIDIPYESGEKSSSARVNMSAAKGGLSVRVRDLYLEGKPPERIREMLKLDQKKFDRICNTLRSWGPEGVDIPLVTLPQRTA